MRPGLLVALALFQGEPAVFAPGVISTANPEFAASLSPDGASFYFNRASADRSRLSILVSHFRDGEWGPPETAPFSGPHRDVDPFVSPDGKRIYFSSSRPTEPGDETPDFNSWFVEREAGGWSAPVVLPEPLNSASQETFVSADREGTLYFGSDRDGTQRIWRSRRIDGEHEAPQLVSFAMNLEGGGGNPWISSSGKLLIFVGSRPGGQDADLYSTCLGESGWLPAGNLGPVVNSEFADFAPSLTPDGRHLIFTSERPGVVPPVALGERPPGDLYRVELDAIEFSCR
jgi:Tol biopolymer transport system component